MTISEDRLEEGLRHLQFEDILQYVAIPSMRIERRPVYVKGKRIVDVPEGKGRTDMILLFAWLRNKGVKRVIRVIVDDTLDPAHSDEAIETALGGLRVEKWDWKKFDISIETIFNAAPHTREVCLYWSGNNAVLRGWAELGGLHLLTKLEKLYLHVGKVCLRFLPQIRITNSKSRDSKQAPEPKVMSENFKNA